jgi:uncharacterized SAM-binding protein YcdF (DUF218 family)
MLILSKILPLFFLPPGICILLAILGLLLRRIWIIWSAVALLWVLSMPIVDNVLTTMIEMPYHRVPMETVSNADAIIVLSGMIQQIDGAPLGEWGEAVDRFEGGIELYKAGKAPFLVFTGGWLPWHSDLLPEGVLLSRRALNLGIPRRSILLTSRVSNTAQEAIAAARLLGVTPVRSKKIILVTSAFHMQRAIMLFRAEGFDIEPFPVDFYGNGSIEPISFKDMLPTAKAQDSIARFMREMIGRTMVYLGKLL